MSSYDFTVSLGLMPIGMAVAGPVAAGVGLHTTLAGMGALGMLAALGWLAVPDVRSVRRAQPAPATDPERAAAADRVDPDPAVVGPGPGAGRGRFERDRDRVEER